MIVGILLAAGRGERFGGGKLLSRLPDGRYLAEASAGAMTAALTRVVAVVRSDDTALAAVLRACGCEIVVCPSADEGMGASLACGVAACRDASGWIVALADMPAIRPATIGRVATELAGGARLAAPEWRGRRGHPVGFAARFGDRLAALGGDEGARAIVRDGGQDLVLFETADAGVVFDVDRPTDLDSFGPA